MWLWLRVSSPQRDAVGASVPPGLEPRGAHARSRGGPWRKRRGRCEVPLPRVGAVVVLVSCFSVQQNRFKFLERNGSAAGRASLRLNSAGGQCACTARHGLEPWPQCPARGPFTHTCVPLQPRRRLPHRQALRAEPQGCGRLRGTRTRWAVMPPQWPSVHGVGLRGRPCGPLPGTHSGAQDPVFLA